jgi:acyl-CoA reductase-like NAD-dependent aldehyde dehydrogenase/cation diffusion facilitator CzcD-associated flavoprotein CzcO/acetyl esterase/lipase
MTEERAVPAAERAGLEVDVIVVGAGFAGLYTLARLRERRFSVVGLEAGSEVGGTWYWNRYPGLRCDIPTTDYCYSWDPGLEDEWRWSEKYATQPEILRYLAHVADRHDLRRDIRFDTRVTGAAWDDSATIWRVTTERGDALAARHVVMATGALSVPKPVDLPGLADFAGDLVSTARWPDEGLDVTGRRVAVVGTGSSGIQVIPELARDAAELTVFQRTPAFSLPARNGPAPEYRLRMLAEDREGYREAARGSSGGVPLRPPTARAEDLTAEQRRERCEAAWQAGEISALNEVFADHLTDAGANAILADFVREKIRTTVRDPGTAETLCPSGFPFMAKRPCFDTGYYETFNAPHVRLVDIRTTPISRVVENGIETTAGVTEIDTLVFATGYDAMTGALLAIDPTGRGGQPLSDAWKNGPRTYLGLMTSGFPNLFMITGPGSPSVLSNMIVAIEQHVEWVTDCLVALRDESMTTIEPTETAERGWVQHVHDCADVTLFPQADSWYLGANVPGKPRVFMPYVGGVGVYRDLCAAVSAQDYLGFRRTGPAGERCTDGVIAALRPDVAALVRELGAAGEPDLGALPLLDEGDARRALAAVAAGRRRPPRVAEIWDGESSDGLPHRVYRPDGAEPHPVVVHLVAAPWDLLDPGPDAFARDLARRADVLVVSVPVATDPRQATDQGADAVRWVRHRCTELGGTQRVAVAGWSAGASVAAAVAHALRDDPDAPAAQLLVNPVGPGAADPGGQAPAIVVLGELDPAYDEGAARAAALVEAGVPTTTIVARGHVHASLTIVDLLSGEADRDRIAAALRRHLEQPRRGGGPMEHARQFYIGGRWVDPAGSRTSPVVDPATEQTIDTIALGEAADVDAAVAAARGAFAVWSQTSVAERLALLDRITEVYAKRVEDIGETISREIGAPRALAVDVQAAVGVVHLETTRKVLADFEFERRQGTTLVVHEPIGVCALITPWNWPIHQIVPKVAAALATGCTMVLKPSEVAPLNALLLAEVLDEAGVPAGVFNLVNGDGPTVGGALAAHPDVDMVSFTGSTRAGVDVARAAAPTVKRVTQELGGKSANILLDGPDLAAFVARDVGVLCTNSGQSCNAPTRMLVPAARMAEAVQAAAAAAEAVVVGPPTAKETAMGPLASAAQFHKVQDYIARGIAEGATMVAGGPGRPDGLESGYYVRPTVFADVDNSMAVAREEIFGPVLVLIGYADEDEAVRIADDSDYGLSAWVSGDPERARALARRLRTGEVHVNGADTDFGAPYGGYRRSGNGREFGAAGFAEYLETKSILGFE